MSPKPHLLTLTAAAAKLGIHRPRAGRWLKLQVLRRERNIGKPILVRHGDGAVRSHYLVNMATLRRYYPDLFDGRDEILAAAKALTKGTDAKLGQVDERLGEVDAKLAAIVVGLRKRAS